MLDEKWFWAVCSVTAGVLVGSLVGVILRRLLDRDGRRPAFRETAAALSLFAFWLLSAAGVVVAVATTSPDTLRPLPAQVLEWLPNVALAGVLLIGGYGLGVTVAAAIGRSASSIAGVRRRSLERIARTTVFGGALILALGQLGVNTTALNILVAATAFGLAAALAGVAVVGGRAVSGHVAAGRVLQRTIAVDDRVAVDGVAGVVAELLVTHAVIADETGRTLVPYGWMLDRPVRIENE